MFYAVYASSVAHVTTGLYLVGYPEQIHVCETKRKEVSLDNLV